MAGNRRRKKVEAVIIHAPQPEPPVLTEVPVYGDEIRVGILPVHGDQINSVDGSFIGIQDSILWFVADGEAVVGVPLLRIESIEKI